MNFYRHIPLEALFSKADEVAKFEWIFLEIAENILALFPPVAKTLSCVLNCRVGRAKTRQRLKAFSCGQSSVVLLHFNSGTAVLP